MKIEYKEFRSHVNEWCTECVNGPDSNKKCRECSIDISTDDNENMIGEPTNFEPLNRSTQKLSNHAKLVWYVK